MLFVAPSPRRLPSIGVAVVLLAISARVQAAPAVVKVFEGTARARPEPAAPVVHVFPEGSALSVSEDVVDGWRRVRLPDGGVGFIRDDEVALKAGSAAGTSGEDESAEPAAPVAPLAPAPARAVRQAADDETEDAALGRAAPSRPGVRRRGGPIYVKDLDHLAELIGNERVVGPMAQHLVERKFQANVAGGVGLVVGGALGVGAFLFPRQDCTEGVPSLGIMPSCISWPRLGLLTGGVAVMGVGIAAALLLRPWRTDILDVVNAWNERHPDEPFTVHEAARRPTFVP